MKKYSVDFIYSMLLKYLWLICAAVLALELVFTVNTAVYFTENSSRDIMSATNRELENKLNVTWTLGDAMAQDKILTDTSITLEDRALYLAPYNEVYNLFLIGITDVAGKITSSYDNIPGEIGHRDYFQHSIQTGETVITDAFPAGADGTTLNYTICLPYRDKAGAIAGTIIMSIPFDGVNEIIAGATRESSFMFTLLGTDNKVMAEKDEQLIGSDFSALINGSSFLSVDAQELLNSVYSAQTGTYWTMDSGRLLYVSYAPVPRTPWKLLTSIDVFDSCKSIILSSLFKSVLLLLIFTMVFIFGKRYMEAKLADTGEMIRQMEKLQNNLLEEKLITSDTLAELVDISKSGLMDSLTRLPTRLSIKKMMDMQLEQLQKQSQGIFLLIDLDDLKSINDSYGHIVGDRAIAAFGDALRLWAKESGGIAGRFGGDEFIAFYVGVDHQAVVEKLMNALRIELAENDATISLHASMGVAVYPVCGTDFQRLYIAADKALYTSKKQGKNCYTFSEEYTTTPCDSVKL